MTMAMLTTREAAARAGLKPQAYRRRALRAGIRPEYAHAAVVGVRYAMWTVDQADSIAIYSACKAKKQKI